MAPTVASLRGASGPTDELVKAVSPQALLVNRMMVDHVVECPRWSIISPPLHPTTGRDEKFSATTPRPLPPVRQLG